MAAAAPAAPTPPALHVAAVDLRTAMTTPDRLWAAYGHDISSFTVNLAAAAAILIATFWAAGWGAKLASEAMGRLHRRRGEVDTTLQSFMGSLTRYVIVIVGLVAVLQQLGVKTTSVLAVLGAASIAVGLALQGTLSNVAAGVMLLLFRFYRVGDTVSVGGRLGVVKTLDLFVTELATPDNLKVIAPNGKIFGDTIVNYTTPVTRRVDVVFHIGPKQDLAAVLDALQALMLADERVLKDPAPIYEATALNEAFAEGAARVWAKPADYGVLQTKIILAVQKLSIDQPPPA